MRITQILCIPSFKNCCTIIRYMEVTDITKENWSGSFSPNHIQVCDLDKPLTSPGIFIYKNKRVVADNLRYFSSPIISMCCEMIPFQGEILIAHLFMLLKCYLLSYIRTCSHPILQKIFMKAQMYYRPTLDYYHYLTIDSPM